MCLSNQTKEIVTHQFTVTNAYRQLQHHHATGTSMH